LILWRGERSFAVLNAFPYGSGHLMVLPNRAVPDLGDLTGDEASELWRGVHRAVAAIREAYDPDGINVGLNLGAGAGAGVPDHLHVHCLPRWSGDTDFMTTVAETRVLPKPLSTSWAKLRAAWPGLEPRGTAPLPSEACPIRPKTSIQPRTWSRLSLTRWTRTRSATSYPTTSTSRGSWVPTSSPTTTDGGSPATSTS